MKELSTIEHLSPAIDTMGDILTETSNSYQQLLTQPQSHSSYIEVGRSLRCLYDRYSQVLVKAFECTPDPAEIGIDDRDYEDDIEDLEDQDDVTVESEEDIGATE